MLRGGSFNNNENNARCASRNRNNPDNRNNNIGFRVVLSHIFRLRAGNTAGWPPLRGRWVRRRGILLKMARPVCLPRETVPPEEAPSGRLASPATP
ncbi:MAG: SUMF1/EgtB/PvdO family nonheme iron enzyme [Anaerolineales bacterium]|nr:SUMF1/EgtB/PvdO family nonheme iron enzyme [Anaerolineales bacterium]